MGTPRACARLAALLFVRLMSGYSLVVELHCVVFVAMDGEKKLVTRQEEEGLMGRPAQFGHGPDWKTERGLPLRAGCGGGGERSRGGADRAAAVAGGEAQLVAEGSMALDGGGAADGSAASSRATSPPGTFGGEGAGRRLRTCVW